MENWRLCVGSRAVAVIAFSGSAVSARLNNLVEQRDEERQWTGIPRVHLVQF